ncbi:glycosyltransferase [Acidibrevibacterium fodinaquatile]|uniref:glycosyltransferase n=1 Tax=Acidibrevibacterium fodinaquatile TaxID=1969806 RepID=UPI000E0D9CA6|nr:glycosyltransferase [Acidibrevibacterium fodinaquatile]
MRIVLDLQSVQEPNYRARGIGRGALSLALAMARQPGRHEIILALNGAFAESIEFLNEKFKDLLPPESFKIWRGLTPTHASDPANRWRRKASELLREEFLAALQPDIVLVTSLFQGLGDNSVISIGAHRPNLITAVIHHDLIPLVYPEHYLADPTVAAWYYERLDHLRRADLILANSESTRLEIIDYLGLEAAQTVSVPHAMNSDFFGVTSLSDEAESRLRKRYGLDRPFVMYTGGDDFRKNIASLIGAFSRINKNSRQKYQLAVVCSLSSHSREHLEKLAAKRGMEPGEVIFTDFVSDDDLLALYNLCHLFVFPSWHEGFGLPVLEAMACGAPTLASNCSSLPEVIGWEEALFDPRDEREIARAIEHALTDEGFRQKLKTHGLRQAAKFSWDVSAQRALRAVESFVDSHQVARPAALSAKSMTRRPRLAYFSPLQPTKSGISDYSAELLPELARHYDIDVVVDQQEAVIDPWVLANSTQRSVAWFEGHADSYDRILYHFGNSSFHQHMFELLDRYPGVVVLHDFFLSGIVAHMEMTGFTPGIWARALQYAHGWEALRERRDAEDTADVIYKYPCNLEVLQRAQGVICHSDYSRQLVAEWYGPDWGKDWALIPLLRVPRIGQPRHAARESLRLNNDDFVVCSFGDMVPTKCNIDLLESWTTSALSKDRRCKLVFVGASPQGGYGEEIRQWLQRAELKHRVRITGWVGHETYQNYLAAADLAVQLRTLSRGETSAAVLDCMNYGLPTIVNANGSMKEFPTKAVRMLADNFTTAQLARALEELWRSPAKRATLGKRAAEHIHEQHAPRHCADLYATAIEQFAQRAGETSIGLLKEAARLGMPSDRQDLAHFATRAAQLFPTPRLQTKQLLLDVSELAQRDAKTGIQRVVRSILAELLDHPPAGYRVEPVFATMEHGYRYARRFTARFLDLGDVGLSDDPVEIRPGDVFVGLDLQPEVVPRHQGWLQEIRLKGVAVYFVCYDLLLVTRPEFFSGGVTIGRAWLEVISQSDGVVCISQTVAQELKRWFQLFGKREGKPLKIGWWHLGSDLTLKVSGHDHGVLPAQARLFDAMRKYPSFLMVGTIEPRKGHTQVLAAFDLLWRKGIKVNLVIVGKLGWMVDIEEKVNLHPERDRQLFWLQGIGDDLLEQIYAASTCLIAASADEGFGLPLIEAARHRLPILARDIPVFREVAGDHALYFSGEEPRAVAEAVKTWLDLDRQGRAPRSDAMPWLTWKQSTWNLLDIILGGEWQSEWVAKKDADLVFRYWGSDDGHHTQVGERRGTCLYSTGRAGFLLYGARFLQKGKYRAIIHGKVGFGGVAGAYADVAIKAGTAFLAKAYLRPGEDEQDAPVATLNFSLDENRTDLEIRVFVEENSDVRVSLVELRNGSAEPERLASGDGKQRITQPPRALLAPVPPAWDHRYWASHPRLLSQIGHRVGRNVWSTGEAGYLLHGPYIGLPAGTYVATVYGALNKPGAFGGAYIDVAAKKDELRLTEKKLAESAARPGVLGVIEFTLDGYMDDVEVRLWVDAETDLHATGIEITEARIEASNGATTLASIEAAPLLNGTTTAAESAPPADPELAKPRVTADGGPPRGGMVQRKQRSSTKKRQGQKASVSIEV